MIPFLLGLLLCLFHYNDYLMLLCNIKQYTLLALPVIYVSLYVYPLVWRELVPSILTIMECMYVFANLNLYGIYPQYS